MPPMTNANCCASLRTLAHLALRLVSCLSLACITAPAFADALQAIGANSLRTSSDTFFFFPPSNGTNCVSVEAGTATGSGVGSCTISFGFFTNVQGRGITEAKLPNDVTSSLFFDVASQGGTVAFGQSRWEFEGRDIYQPRADYLVQTSITPTPPTVRARARARAADPITLTGSTPGVLAVGSTLSNLDLEIPANASGGFGGDYRLDGELLFEYLISVDGGFNSLDDIAIMYKTTRGSAFDEAMKTTIRNRLLINPTLGTVALAGPFEIFPTIELLLAAGDHSLDGGAGAFVEATPIPEPSSVLLVIAGLATMVGIAHGNKRKRGHTHGLSPCLGTG